MMRILTPIGGLIVGVPLLLSIVPSVLVVLPVAAVVYWAAISLKQEFFGFGSAAFNGDIKLSDGTVSLRFDENGMSTTHVVHPNPSMAWLLTDTVTVIKLGGNEVTFVAHPHLPEHTTHQLHQLLATRIGPPTPIRQETGSTLAEVGKLLGAMLLLMALMFVGVSFR